MDKARLTPELRELSDSIDAGKSVAFVGSGLSIGEYISWGTLVRRLCDACGVDFDSEDVGQDLLKLAQKAKNASAEHYHRVLSEEFGKKGVHVPLGYTYLIESPFDAYITVNYDRLLAEAGRFKELDLYSFKGGLNVKAVKDKAIFYIHGFVAEGASVVDGDLILTEEDFEHNYESKGSIIPSFLTQVLSFQPVVFVGCGLQEPALRKILDICNEIKIRLEETANTGGPKHYILLPTVYTKMPENPEPIRNREKEDEEDSRFRDIGVQVVRYHRSSPDDHGPVEEILREWSKAPEMSPISAYDEGLRNE